MESRMQGSRSTGLRMMPRRAKPSGVLSLGVLLSAAMVLEMSPARAQFAGRQTTPAVPVVATALGPVQPLGPPTAGLPLRDVVLFSSGVGYFGRAGRVNGEGEVELAFRAPQINDILKSLVVFDPAGEVRPVAYSIEDFVARRPRSSDLPVNSSNTLGGLLRQFQGALVRLETRGEAVEGRIVSVSSRNVALPVPNQVLTVESVTILTTSGLRAVSLDDVTQARLLDAALDRKLRASLEKIALALTSDLDDGTRPVRLRFSGRGEREVRAGYLQEMPVWKTSYRLVLDEDTKDKKKTQPYLQGWAQVENTTEDDWNAVRLSLISGRPVSFIQNLYQPLYISRPTVAPQILGSPLPQTYGETLTLADTDPQNALLARGQREGRGGMAGGAPGPAGPPGLAARNGAVFMNRGDFDGAEAARRGDIAASAEQLARTAAQAAGSERGELFEYAIKQPVTLRRGQAAMVPIVSRQIEGEKLSIFDAGAGVLRAVHGFRLHNTTGLHLAGGPITVFRDGIYAGDAQINNVQPDENRLISYALDLDLVVGREDPKVAEDLVSLAARSGVLLVTRKQRRAQTYTFRNKSDEAKTVIVQQPIEAEWKVTEPAKPFEKSPTENRFRVAVAPKKTAQLKVVSERPVSQELALLDMDFNLLVAYARNAEISTKLRAALQDLVTRRRKVSELQAQRVTLEAELKAIDEEQSRIRQNMAQLDRNGDLYKQYIRKLTEQETRVETVRAEIARLHTAEIAAQKELRDFVDKLTVQ